MRERNGFTLIELLVVIAIIGLLASIVFTSVSNVRMKARDARRISDLHQIRNALEIFYNTYGYYPNAKDQTVCTPAGWGGGRSTSVLCGGSMWLTDNANFSQFMPQVPVDPINNPTNVYAEDGAYSYTYSANLDDNHQHYSLRALLEDTSNSNACKFKCYKDNGAYSLPVGSAWCANDPVSNPCGGTSWWENASNAQLYVVQN